MSPAIRPRKRPRKTSYTLHRLHWLLVREAALRVLYPGSVGFASEIAVRRYLARQPSDKLQRLVGVVLKMQPQRRHWPPVP